MKNAVRVLFATVIALEIFGPELLPHAASDFTWIGLIVTVVFAWIILEIFRLSALVFWMAFISVILDIFSDLLQLYSRIGVWDRWIHTFGGAIIALAALELVLRALRQDHLAARREDMLIPATVYMFTATIGFLYEFLEYLVDKLQYGYPRSLVSAYNSIEDQLFNLLGATLVLAAYFWWRRERRERKPQAIRDQL